MEKENNGVLDNYLRWRYKNEKLAIRTIIAILIVIIIVLIIMGKYGVLKPSDKVCLTENTLKALL